MRPMAGEGVGVGVVFEIETRRTKGEAAYRGRSAEWCAGRVSCHETIRMLNSAEPAARGGETRPNE